MSSPVNVTEPAPSDDDRGTPQPVSHPRIEVVRGGGLRVEQIAALTVALAARTAAPATGSAAPDHAWSRAARIEATGRPRVDRPSDLDHAG